MAGIDACIEHVLTALEPPPKQTVSEWADANRRLSPEASAEPGEWRTDRAPYQRGILDALSPNSPHERVVFMSSSQVGKSECLNSFIGYIIDRDPGPTLVVLPRVEDGEAWSKDRLAPMLRDTPCLQGKVADVRSRDSNNRILHKRFPGGSITIAGANSPAGLAMRPIRYVLLDEVDRYPASAGTEGDPVSLAVKRSSTWWNRKIFLASSPTAKGASRIEAWWLRSNQSSFWLPCPECGAYQVLMWEQLEWPEGQPDLAQYRCEHCQALIPPHRKPWMLARGEWRAGNLARIREHELGTALRRRSRNQRGYRGAAEPARVVRSQAARRRGGADRRRRSASGPGGTGTGRLGARRRELVGRLLHLSRGSERACAVEAVG
jgi:phage terminase large subunit GpA-like protein